MAAQNKGRNVFHGDFELFCQEVAEASGIKNTGHTADFLMGKAREFAQRPDHRVKRVGDTNNKCVRSMRRNTLAHGFHHLEVDTQKIVAAHAGLARDTGGYDADICARDILVRLCAGHFRIELGGGAAFCDIQRFAFGDAFCDVEENNVTELLERSKMCKRAADLASADQCYFGSCHGKYSAFELSRTRASEAHTIVQVATRKVRDGVAGGHPERDAAWVAPIMVLDLTFFLIAGPAVLFAGISKGGFGSGAAFASAGILALVVEPGLALGVMLPLLMLIDVSTLGPYWRKWDNQAAALLVFGALPGVALGAALYTVAAPDVFRVLIGVISVGFVVWQIATSKGIFRAATQQLPVWAGATAGLVAGFTSFVSHAGGPPAAVYLLSKKIGKTEYQATTVLVFWAVNIAKFVPYAFLGMFTLETATANLLLAPFALFGAWIGVKAHRLVPEHLFFALTYVLLTVTGCKLIWDGLT